MGLVRTAAFLLALALPGAAIAQGIEVERQAEEGVGSVNSWIVRAPGGIFVVDAQRTLSRGRAVAEALGATPAAILLTHAHPDHVGGLAALVEATGAPVMAAGPTRDEMRDDTRGLLVLSRQTMGEEFAETLPPIDTVLADGQRIALAGETVEVIVLGPSEAASAVLYWLPERDVAFGGDLATPDMTPFLLEKRTAAWLADLAAMADRLPAGATLYPGHGPEGRLAELIGRQRDYLGFVRDAVEAALGDGTLDAEERAEIAARIETRWPHHLPVAALPELMDRNLRAVAAELSGEPGAPPVETLKE